MYSPTTPPFGHPSSREEGNGVTIIDLISILDSSYCSTFGNGLRHLTDADKRKTKSECLKHYDRVSLSIGLCPSDLRTER